MRMTARRVLVAATVTAALALPSAASASCVPDCYVALPEVPVSAAETVKCLPICMDEVIARLQSLLASREGDGAGTFCAYAKLSGSPPPGWSGGDGGAPYFWLETQEWGRQNPGQYHVQLCVPGCEAENVLPEEPDLDPSGPPSLTSVKEAAACAVPLPL